MGINAITMGIWAAGCGPISASASVSDPYWSYVTNLLHFEGANGSTIITDQKGYTWTCSGNAQISTERSASGVASSRFDGADDKITSASSASFYNFLHNGSTWTFECSLYLDSTTGSTSRVIFTNNLGISSNIGIVIFIYATGQIGVNITRGVSSSFVFNLISSSVVSAGMFHKIAIVHDQSASYDLNVYLDGVMVAQADHSNPYSTADAYDNASIGATSSNTFDFLGNIDELRITNGIARYSAAYAPSLPFPDQ